MKKILLGMMLLSSVLAFAELKVIKQSEVQNVYNYQVADYQIVVDKEFSEILGSKMNYVGDVGSPKIPQKILDFIVPIDGNISVKVLDYKSEIIKLEKPIVPVEDMVKDKETYRMVRIINEEEYQEIEQLIDVGELTRYRQYNYFPVTFSPYIYNHEKLTLEVVTSVIFQINISAPQFSGLRISDKFSGIYDKMFENYQIAQNFGIRRTPKTKSLNFSTSDFWYRLEVEGDGVFFLEEQLDDLPNFVSENQLSIKKSKYIDETFVWQEVATLFKNNGSDDITGKDRLYFENLDSGNVLWLNISVEPNRVELRDFDSEDANSVLDFKRKNLSEPTRENYDSIIIYPADNVFNNQAEELADFYLRNYNLQSLLINQEDIFDRYTGGNETQFTGERAVRDTLEACVANYSNLEFVTLLGSGTSAWDVASSKNKIITFYSSILGFISDDFFAIFSNSPVPELVIGRMPAQNDSQMDEMVRKLISFVEIPEMGLWRDRALLVADDENKSGWYEGMSEYSGDSTGMNHSKAIEDISNLIAENVIVDKIFAFNYGFDEFHNKPAVKEKQVEMVNNGTALWIFVGHGNPIVLGDEDYFTVPDLELLENENRLPIFIAASCSVGDYTDANVDCLAEQILYLDNGGAIGSIAATDGTGPGANILLFSQAIPFLLNENMSAAQALLSAKVVLNSSLHQRYNLLGSPVFAVPIPENLGEFAAVNDSLQARETVSISGTIGSAISSGVGLLNIYDSKKYLNYTNYFYHTNQSDDDLWEYYSVDYTKRGNAFFSGHTTISNGEFNAEFIVPDDISDGDEGKMFLYFYDEISGNDYVSYKLPIDYSSVPIDVEDNTPPSVSMKLDSDLFQSGDYVSTNPLFMADIEDDNGINILGIAGHRILMLIDGDNPVDVTSGFVYDENSARKGKLTWKLSQQLEGEHLLQLIVFDNFNNFRLAEVDFVAKTSSKIFIEDMLVYPNPLNSDDGTKFTFVITDNADITITIYTITGRRIMKLTKELNSAGYTEIYWNGKDADGDALANGTYFYKVAAKQKLGGKSTEKISKLIILK